jgi:hypothetical protein
MGVYLPACCPFRFKGAWSEEFKLYSIGRDPNMDGIVFGHVWIQGRSSPTHTCSLEP